MSKLNTLRPETTRILPQTVLESHIVALQTSRELVSERRKTLDQQYSQKLEKKISLIQSPKDMVFGSRPQAELFSQFLEDLRQERRIMPLKQRQKFDSLWGLSSDGKFLPQHNSIRTSATSDCSEVLSKEYDLVMAETEQKVEDLRTSSSLEAGMEILHIFILDLLGRDTAIAKIFLSKSQEDFRHSMVVSKAIKAIAWCVVFLLNIFFIYFSLLRAIQRGSDWQRMYLLAVVIQFSVEVFFYETTECALINFFIPNLVRNEVRSVAFTVHQVIQNLSVSSTPPILNVPSYFFVSNHLATQFPDLLESCIVRSYHTNLPGELSSKWNSSKYQLRYVFQPFNSSQSTRVRYFPLTTLIIKFLQQIGSLSNQFQRVIIHLIQPLLLSVFLLFGKFLTHHPLYFIGLGVLLLILLIFFIRQLVKEYNEENQVRDTTPPLVHPKGDNQGKLSSLNLFDSISS